MVNNRERRDPKSNTLRRDTRSRVGKQARYEKVKRSCRSSEECVVLQAPVTGADGPKNKGKGREGITKGCKSRRVRTSRTIEGIVSQQGPAGSSGLLPQAC